MQFVQSIKHLLWVAYGAHGIPNDHGHVIPRKGTHRGTPLYYSYYVLQIALGTQLPHKPLQNVSIRSRNMIIFFPLCVSNAKCLTMPLKSPDARWIIWYTLRSPKRTWEENKSLWKNTPQTTMENKASHVFRYYTKLVLTEKTVSSSSHVPVPGFLHVHVHEDVQYIKIHPTALLNTQFWLFRRSWIRAALTVVPDQSQVYMN